MKKLILTLIITIFTTSIVVGQEITALKTPNSEVEGAILFLSKLPEEEAQFIRFLSTYAVMDSKKRDELALTTSFVLHTMTGINITQPEYGRAGSFYPIAIADAETVKYYRKVPDSDTLFWLDLREYNWTPESWEIVSGMDGYFAEPIVQHDRSGALRLISGNAVLRADWFVYWAMNMAHQEDVGEAKTIYETLLYSLNTVPTTLETWYTAWGIDPSKDLTFQNESYTLVTKSSAVARHNRILLQRRTLTGYAYETFDVKNQQGKRDYIEAFFRQKRIGGSPDIADAGELFTTNQIGLQTGYALLNRNTNKLGTFGDPGIVRHLTDVIGDPRVRAPHSCIDCHAAGPIVPENTLREFISNNGDLKVYDKRDQLRIQRNYLSGKFEESCADNQVLFARVLKKVNGLEPAENASLYIQAIVDYDRDLTIEQASHECGVSVNDFKTAIANKRFGGRLHLLVIGGESIPRSSWESKGKDGIPGLFQQAMIAIHGITAITDTIERETLYTVFKVIRPTPLMSGKENLGTLKEGSYLSPTGKTLGPWIGVRAKNDTGTGIAGFVNNKDVEELEINEEVRREKFKSFYKHLD